MASVYRWFFLVCILCVSKFGLYFCSIVMLSSIFAIAGFVIVLSIGKNSQIVFPSKPLTYRKKYGSDFTHTGIPKIVRIIKQPSQKSRCDKRLTGSVKVDEPLQEIINNISRDFILSWYNNLSSDEEFVRCIKELFKSIINNVARSTIEIDWVSFFTKHVVDDFASHLRLFRKSEITLKSTQKEQPEKNYNLESVFFDMELTMEKTLCRDIVCTSDPYEKKYLLHLVDLLLYLLLPLEDFKNTSFRLFLRDLLATAVLQPTICSFADPDFINQNLIWLCKDYPLGSKPFLTVIRRTDCLDELSAVKEIAKHELKVQKSKDTRDKTEMKQYSKSITFVHDLANQRYQRLLKCCPDSDDDFIDNSVDIEWKALLDSEIGNKLISLPFDIVLNNNVGLHYFTEFMSSINAQGYLFFYHNIEGFRTTAETLLSEAEQGNSTEEEKVEKLREFAMQIFDAYLGENAVVRVKLDENLLAKLHSRMKTEKLNENFYDSVQSKVYDIMLNDFYTTSFKVSPQYVKLLAELELLPDLNIKDDESLSSSKSDEVEREVDSTSSSSDQDIVITELLGNELPSSEFFFPNAPSLDCFKEHRGDGILTAEIYNTGITHHAGKTFAVYAIAVNHHLYEGPEERWFVVRRYSEFHEFHKAVCDKYPELSNFEFPSKKAFNNLSRHLMEKRRHTLNEYLQFLLLPDILNRCHGLQFMLYNFLEPRVCEKGKKSFVRTVGTLVNPIKTSVKTVGSAVKLVPTTLFSLKDGLVRALSKTSNHIVLEPNFETDKVSAGLDLDAEDIPIRIILLLLDEIFDLKSKDLWFRRRIIALVRQIIKTTQGDAINRKLKNYVDDMASANQVAEWLKQFSQAFWPNGILAQPQQERDSNTKLRTRIAAKTLLLCSIPDELKHIIGSETSCNGAMTIFNLFQNFSLNRRLVYVLLEHFLIALFPQNNICKVLELLHCESPRITPIIPISEEHFGDQVSKTSLEKNGSSKGYSSTLSTTLKSKYKSQVKLTKQDDDHHQRKRRRSLSCISGQDNDTVLSKNSQKRKKSLETAIFYTDITNDQMDVCSDNLIPTISSNM